ncbi:MAG: hypothetical protein H6Q84_597, partial [Deltaproteobacteria bacterium]|nr:hypothetical protein [Deltaproteobacteria bacterium]
MDRFQCSCFGVPPAAGSGWNPSIDLD